VRRIRPEIEDYIPVLGDDLTELEALKIFMEKQQEYLFDVDQYMNYLEQTMEEYERRLYDYGA
jgi:hypothetical protein